MVPTSARNRGTRHRSVAGRPAEDGQQTPPDLRRTRHPSQSHHDRGQRQRRHPDPRPGRRHPTRRGSPRPAPPPTRSLARRQGLRLQPQPRRAPSQTDPARPARGSPDIKGIGKLRYVVEQTFALLHHFKRLAVGWERRPELHDAFVSLACSLICWRRLKKTRPCAHAWAVSVASSAPVPRFRPDASFTCCHWSSAGVCRTAPCTHPPQDRRALLPRMRLTWWPRPIPGP